MDVRDLLVRHEKLVHLHEGASKDSRARRGQPQRDQPRPDGRPDPHVLGMHHATAGQSTFHVEPAPPPPPPVTAVPPNVRMQPRNASCNLDLLSDAALASAVNPAQSMIPSYNRHAVGPAASPKHGAPAYDSQGAYAARQRGEQTMTSLPTGFAPQAAAVPPGPMPPGPVPPGPVPPGDYNFFDDIASSSHFLPPPFDPEQQLGGWRPKGSLKPGPKFASRLPSAQSDQRNIAGDGASSSRPVDDQGRALPFRISPNDHSVLKGRVEEFSSVLPSGFIFPSRHTLIRFIEGYASGFHEHLPFLHLPTLSLVDIAPELMLAILSVGAQCRFEGQRGYALWYAARAVAFAQLKKQQTPEILELVPTSAAYSPHSTPSAAYRHPFPTAPAQDRPITGDAQRERL